MTTYVYIIAFVRGFVGGRRHHHHRRHLFFPQISSRAPLIRNINTSPRHTKHSPQSFTAVALVQNTPPLAKGGWQLSPRHPIVIVSPWIFGNGACTWGLAARFSCSPVQLVCTWTFPWPSGRTRPPGQPLGQPLCTV